MFSIAGYQFVAQFTYFLQVHAYFFKFSEMIKKDLESTNYNISNEDLLSVVTYKTHLFFVTSQDYSETHSPLS